MKGKLLYGPRPSIHKLNNMLIDTVVCVQSGLYNLVSNDEYENIEWPETGMKYYEVGLSDFTPPKLKDVEKIFKIIKRALDRGENVYLHCLSGRDRSGFIYWLFKSVYGERYFDYCLEYKRGYCLEQWNHRRHWWYFYWTPQFKKLYKVLK